MLFKQFHGSDLYHCRKLSDFVAEATLRVLLAEVNNFEFVVKVSYWKDQSFDHPLLRY